MPTWLIPILKLLGPVALRLALKFLESKYPGIKDLIDQIINYVGDEKPEHNVESVREALGPCIGCATETKKS